MTSSAERRPIAWGRVAIPGLILLEIIVAVAVSTFIGVGWTLFALAVLSLLGGWVLLREGRQAWTSFAVAATGPAAAAGGPGTDAPRTATGVAAGLLLAVPGFLTALAGGVLLLPPVRRLAGGRVDVFMKRRRQRSGQGNVVVGEIVVSDVGPSHVGPSDSRPSDTEEPGPPWGPGSRR
jgi:UPF0716 protein FxsA